MFNWLKKRKLKKQGVKSSDFTRVRGYGRSKQYYNENTGEWVYWYLLASVLTSQPEDCEVYPTYSSSTGYDSDSSYNSSSDDYSSSSSYDSGSSYSSGSDSGGSFD